MLDAAPMASAAPVEGRVEADPGGPGGGEGASPLRAGSTDDNADFGAYLAFLDDWNSSGRAGERFEWLDVAVRRFVRVLDAEGRPVPAARVEILDAAGEQTVRSGRTYGDGRMPF